MFVPPMLPQIPQRSAFLSQAKPPTPAPPYVGPFHRHVQDLEKKLEDAVQEMDN